MPMECQDQGGKWATDRRKGFVARRYVVPSWFTRNVVNRLVAGLTRLGISVSGSRVLEVRGRKTGEPRRTPVNLLTLEGASYLVAPRGQTQWVRNLRVAGDGQLLLGRRRSASSPRRSPTPTRSRFCAPTSVDGPGRSACSSAESMQAPPAKSFAGSPPTIRSSVSNWFERNGLPNRSARCSGRVRRRRHLST